MRGIAASGLSVQVNAKLEFDQFLDRSRPNVLLSIGTIRLASSEMVGRFGSRTTDIYAVLIHYVTAIDVNPITRQNSLITVISNREAQTVDINGSLQE